MGNKRTLAPEDSDHDKERNRIWQREQDLRRQRFAEHRAAEQRAAAATEEEARKVGARAEAGENRRTKDRPTSKVCDPRQAYSGTGNSKPPLRRGTKLRGTPISQSAPTHSHPDQTNAAAPAAGARPDVLAVEKPQPEMPAPPTRPPDYNQFCPRDPKLIPARLQDAKPIQAFPKDIESLQSELVRRFGPLPRRRH